MENLIKKFKDIPKGIKVAEAIYFVFILIYLYMLSGGGIFTSYYSFMAVIAVAVIASLYILIFKRNYKIALTNLIVAVLIFIQFVSVAP